MNLNLEINAKLENNTVNMTNKKTRAVSVMLFLLVLAVIGLIMKERYHLGPLVATLISLVICKYLLTALEIFCFQFQMSNILKNCRMVLNESRECNDIKEINLIYRTTANINSSFNSMYGKRCFIITTCSIMAIVWFTFRIGSNYMKILGNDMNLDDCSNGYMINLGVFTFIITLLCWVGSNKQDNASLLLLKAEMSTSYHRGQSTQELENLISRINNLPLPLSAGLFKVDFSLFTTVTGNIITYLVVLFQFQLSHVEQSKEDFESMLLNETLGFY